MSTAGGVDKAFGRGESVGLEVMQIFTKNQNQWRAKPIPAETVDRYFAERERTGIRLVFAHGSYLINPCATDAGTRERSLLALEEELERCELLEIPYLIMHPGSHLGRGESWGISEITKSINQVFMRRRNGKAMLLLENTAGQGSNLGYRFEHLAEMREGIENKGRVGVCFDTCHAFAGGYDLSTPSGVKATFEAFESTIGLEHLRVFHFNDSKKPLGSRVDRHEHIGKGAMGLEVFRFLMRSSLFKDHPMALETPKSEDLHEDLENIETLRNLLNR